MTVVNGMKNFPFLSDNKGERNHQLPYGEGEMNMKSYLQQTTKQTASLALLYILGGIFMCFFSAEVLINLVRVIGACFLIYGIYQAYLYFAHRTLNSSAAILYSIPCIIGGLILLARPTWLISFFPIVVGVIMLINGILQIQRSMILKDARFTGWGFNTLFAIVLMIGGAFLIFNPMGAVKNLLKIGGIFLIVEGIFMLIQSFETKKYL